jgi:hypothetical protein
VSADVEKIRFTGEVREKIGINRSIFALGKHISELRIKIVLNTDFRDKDNRHMNITFGDLVSENENGLEHR